MNLEAITRLSGRGVLLAKQNSPRILFVAGLVGVTTAVVTSSRATLRLGEVLDKPLSQLEDISAVEKDPLMEYDGRDAARDRIVVYSQIFFGLGRLYGPTIIIGGLGIACLTKSHTMLTKQNAALTAAYAALERSYSAYRERVRQSIGEEKEAQLHYEVERDLAEQERQLGGKEKARRSRSQYAKWFNEETTKQWHPFSRDKNLYFISCQERFANEKLHRRGYLFLNEVYESLGLAVTDYGCVVGWVMNGDGDKFVDFGIFDHHTNEVKFFLGGINDEILLDFNVDGLVADKLGG